MLEFVDVLNLKSSLKSRAKSGILLHTGVSQMFPELRQELAGLDVEHALETKREIVEGIYHTGGGVVVHLIARTS